MSDILTLDHAKRILDAAKELEQAAILAGSTSPAFEIQAVTLDLTTAKLSTAPLKIGFPFRCLYVWSATDSGVSVNLRLNTTDSFQSAIPLKINSQLNLPYPVREAYLDWSAQSGKSITLLFFVTGTFTTNSVLSVISGGVNVLEGAALSSKAVAGVSITSTASVICAQDTTRIVETIQNQDSQSIWVGASDVTDDTGAKPGIEIASGGTFIYKNTAALYAVSKGTVTKIARLLETN